MLTSGLHPRNHGGSQGSLRMEGGGCISCLRRAVAFNVGKDKKAHLLIAWTLANPPWCVLPSPPVPMCQACRYISEHEIFTKRGFLQIPLQLLSLGWEHKLCTTCRLKGWVLNNTAQACGGQMLSGCAASRGQPTGLEDADIDGGSGNGRAPFHVKRIVKVTFPKLPTWKQASETLGKK